MSVSEDNEAKTWQIANLLLSITFFILLSLSSYVGGWGLVKPTELDDLRFFPQAFLVYSFSKLLPLPWLLTCWGTFLILKIYQNPQTVFSDITTGYYFALFVPILVLNRGPLWSWILAPISLHFFAALCFAATELLTTGNLADFITKFTALSTQTILWELILVYPLVLLSGQINKLFNWFRHLE